MYNNMNYAICKQVNRIKLNLILFGHARVNAEWQGSVYSPVFSRLYYIAGGRSSITPEGGEKVQLEAGKWYLIPTGCSFSYQCDEEMEHYYFHLKLSDYDGTDLLRKCQAPLCLELQESYTAVMDRCATGSDVSDGLALQNAAFAVLSVMLRRSGTDLRTENYSPCVMKAIRYINDNLSVKLTIAEIAEAIFVSKSALTKSFRKELAMSVNEYIYDVVMSKAEYLLRAGDLSISEISERFGFYDQFYFSKRFREKFKRSPREYRKDKPI